MAPLLAFRDPPVETNERLAATIAAQAPRLRAFVRRQVADLAEVEDIVQDAFLQLISAHRLAEPVRHAAAWLRRVARNRIIDGFRQQARADRLFERPTADHAGDDPGGVADTFAAHARAPDTAQPEVGYERDFFTKVLVNALEELPVEQRETFVAHELDGRSFKELAAATGLPINTLLSRKHAAVRHLRRRLRDFDSNPGD